MTSVCQLDRHTLVFCRRTVFRTTVGVCTTMLETAFSNQVHYSIFSSLYRHFGFIYQQNF